MNDTTKNIIIGSFIAITSATIIILAIEEAKSFLQIFCGFITFVIPFSFLTSFGSKVGSFFFVFFSIILGYLVSKFMFDDFWIGTLLAAIIGGSIFYFRIYKHKQFSITDYQRANKEDNKTK